MKKKIMFVLIFIFATFILYAIFITRVFNKEMIIPAPISLVTKHVSSIGNIAKWYLPFASIDTSTLKISRDKIEYGDASLNISKHVGLSVWYEIAENKKKGAVIFSVLADTGKVSKVILSYENTLWNEIFGTNIVNRNAEESLKNLKEYFGDSKKMYGYEMEVTELTDTAYLFSSKVVSNKTKNESFKNLFESLIKYALEKDLAYTGVRIFYTSPYGNDSIHLFTSIGITNTKDVPLEGIYSLKKMPYKGRLLTTYYQGSFDNVDVALNALAQFKTDHNMTSMAIPFVKLISEGVNFDDKQIIQARACYPVN